MAFKAMLVIATVLAVGQALPAPEDQLQITEVKSLPQQTQYITIPVQEQQQEQQQQQQQFQARGDAYSSGVPIQIEDTYVAADEPKGWGWQPEAAPVAASSGGWGWQPEAAPVVASSGGWGWPKFKYLKFTIPIPILPRIKFGIKGGLRLNAAIQHPKGWGWSR